MKITVFLADDHAIVRDGLRLLLAAQADITVIGDAANGRIAVQQATALKPDVVIMDIAMPELNGIEATWQLREVCPEARVIILSMHATATHILNALRAGARGYLLKVSAGAEVVDAVRTVHAGQHYLSQQISEQMIAAYLQQAETAQVENPLDELSPREREVLQLLVEDKSNSEIAQLLSLSPKTIESYRSRLIRKLGVNGISGLVKFAIQYGLTPLE